MPPLHHPSFLKWLKANQSDFNAIVLDIDGVLLRGKTPLPNALELIAYLRTQHIPFSLLTNDGSRSPAEKAGQLTDAGLPISPSEIIACSEALRMIVEQHQLHNQCFFVMGRLGTPCFGERAGLKITNDPEQLPTCQGIIVGEGIYDWRTAFNGVLNFLKDNPEAPMIVPNPDDYYPASNNRILIGAGGNARFLTGLLAQYGVNITPIFLGKPHTPIFQFNHRILEERAARQLKKSSVLMVGDSMHGDIPGAQQFGYRTALMLTGITRIQQLATFDQQPDWIFDNL